MILAYSWARPAILAAGKGRGGLFLFLISAFAWGRTHAMQALTNAASNVFTNCATETTPKKVVQIVLIKSTEAAVHLIFRSLVFLFICPTWIIFHSLKLW